MDGDAKARAMANVGERDHRLKEKSMPEKLTDFERSMLKILAAGNQVKASDKRKAWSFYLKRFRQRYRLTQEEAADILGLVPFTISAHECMRRTPKLETAQRVIFDIKILEAAIDQIVRERKEIEKNYPIADEAKKSKHAFKNSLNPMMNEERQDFIEIIVLLKKELRNLDYLELFLEKYFALLNTWLKDINKYDLSFSMQAYLTGMNMGLLKSLIEPWIISKRADLGRLCEDALEGF